MAKQKFEVVGAEYYISAADYVKSPVDGTPMSVDGWEFVDGSDGVFQTYTDRAEAVRDFFRSYQPEALSSDSCRVYELDMIELDDNGGEVDRETICSTDFPEIAPFYDAQFREKAREYERAAAEMVGALDTAEKLDGYEVLCLVECASDAWDALHDSDTYSSIAITPNARDLMRWEGLEDDEPAPSYAICELRRGTTYAEFVEAVYHAYTAPQKQTFSIRKGGLLLHLQQQV